MAYHERLPENSRGDPRGYGPADFRRQPGSDHRGRSGLSRLAQMLGILAAPVERRRPGPGLPSRKGYDPAEFNPLKMWIEYANRLVGVAIGILVFVTFLRSFRYRNTRPVLFYCAGLCFALVVFQGWLGGQVVRSGLQPGIITLHMALAVILLCALLYVTFQSLEQRIRVELTPEARITLRRLGFALLAVTILQLLLGTQVREGIDPFIKDAGGLPREEWLSQVGLVDHVHRLSSWLVLLAGALVFRSVRRHAADSRLMPVARFILAGIVLQILIGITLAYGDLPRPAQVMHLTLATLLVCAECMLLLMISAARR